MRKDWLMGSFLMMACLGCAPAEVKPPPGADKADTSLEVKVDEDSMGEPTDAPAKSDSEEKEKKSDEAAPAPANEGESKPEEPAKPES